ncbi:MAG TPA: hypothetical protein VNR11_15890 [Xanthobacteraceae bacterium]|nr:hypothetical protein [Xanthobacteraceae bacterium]
MTIDERQMLAAALLGVAAFELLLWLSAVPMGLTTPWRQLPRETAFVLVILPLPVAVAAVFAARTQKLWLAAAALALPAALFVAYNMWLWIAGSRLAASTLAVMTRIGRMF